MLWHTIANQLIACHQKVMTMLHWEWNMFQPQSTFFNMVIFQFMAFSLLFWVFFSTHQIWQIYLLQQSYQGKQQMSNQCWTFLYYFRQEFMWRTGWWQTGLLQAKSNRVKRRIKGHCSRSSIDKFHRAPTKFVSQRVDHEPICREMVFFLCVVAKIAMCIQEHGNLFICTQRS